VKHYWRRVLDNAASSINYLHLGVSQQEPARAQGGSCQAVWRIQGSNTALPRMRAAQDRWQPDHPLKSHLSQQHAQITAY
jgi:hypothetical protein